MSQPNKKFRFEKLNINVKTLVVFLLIMDTVILGIILLRKDKPAGRPVDNSPTPMTEIAVTPEPTSTPQQR